MPNIRRFTPVSEWHDARHILGVKGERIAMAFLTSCGWSLEAHRFRLGGHDIDLVVRKGHTVAFVEVKTRRSRVWGSGLEAISLRKQRRISRAARGWLLRHGRPDDEYRFDVVAVGAGTCAPAIEHIPDAWRPVSPWQ